MGGTVGTGAFGVYSANCAEVLRRANNVNRMAETTCISVFDGRKGLKYDYAP